MDTKHKELFVSFARFVANYKHRYATSYEEMFDEWVAKKSKSKCKHLSVTNRICDTCKQVITYVP